MDRFLLTPSTLQYFIIFLPAAVSAVYLFGIRGKSKATWALAVFVAIFAVGVGAVFLASATSGTYSDSGRPPLLLSVVLALAGAYGFAAYVQFAYAFLENPFPDEARRALMWSLGILAVYTLLVLFRPGDYETSRVLLFTVRAVTTLVLFAWANVVLGRKWLRARREGGAEGARKARAYAAYLGASTCFIAALVAMAIPAEKWSGGLAHPADVVFQTFLLIFIFGLVLAYVHYSPEPTTFQVKLVGLALIPTMFFFSISIRALHTGEQPGHNVTYAPEDRQMVRFEALSGGRYDVSRESLPPRTEAGERLDAGDQACAVTGLGFAFPYAGAAYETVCVGKVPVVFFEGAPASVTPASFYDATPKVAPFLVDRMPAQEVSVWRAPGSAVLTWRAPAEGGRESRVGLVLEESGHMAFLYDGIDTGGRAGVAGFHPGGQDLPVSFVRLTTVPPFTTEPGVVVAEDFVRSYREAVHPLMARLAGLLMLATLLIVVGFPLFFRGILLKPLQRLLEGVGRVNEGKLGTFVDIRTMDEIGVLTANFNRMSDTLKAADEQLRRHAGELEEQVEKRTSELRRSLEELKSAQDQLVQQEKLASLGQLTAGIAHEIKNPLNFINNFAAICGELTEELYEACTENRDRTLGEVTGILDSILADLRMNAEKIQEHGKRADGIVKSMLLHSRGAPGERTLVDLNGLLDEYVNLAYHGARAQAPCFSVKLVKEYDPGVGQASVVAQDMGRVFLNLVNNAFHAVAEKCRKAGPPYEPVVTVRTRRLDRQVEVTVADNGGGIPESIREHVFEPFFTTKPTGHGTGLGLSLAYEIVTAGHGGRLFFESTEGEGTTFHVVIPAEYEVNVMEEKPQTVAAARDVK